MSFGNLQSREDFVIGGADREVTSSSRKAGRVAFVWSYGVHALVLSLRDVFVSRSHGPAWALRGESAPSRYKVDLIRGADFGVIRHAWSPVPRP